MMRNRSIPDSPVIPVISCENVMATADWLTRAFGFSLRITIGDHRVQMNAGGGAIVLAQGRRPAAPGVSIMIRTADVDALCDRAAAAGAKVLSKPATFPYGERQCSIEDANGLIWTFSESVADIGPEEWGGVAAPQSSIE